MAHRSDTGLYTGFTLMLPVTPVPASRPRVTKYGVYYTKTYRAYRAAAHAAIPVCKEGVLTGELGATVEFVCHTPKKITMVSPRGDIDNHLKAIFDAIVGMSATSKQKCRLKNYIGDDELISAVDARMRYAEPDEEPHTIITIGLL